MNSTHSAEPICVLSISANDQDHASLASAFGHSRWAILRVLDLVAASIELGHRNVSVIVYDCDSTPEHWIEILRCVQQMPDARSVVLTSRIADDDLWTQALEYDA